MTVKQNKRNNVHYCNQYFTKFGAQADLERMDIERAFLYLKRAFLEQTKFNANNHITEKLLTSYEQLITTMSEYEFTAHKKNSWGACQTNSNQDILFDISLLKPVLTMSIKNIDIYLDQIMFVDQMELFYHILMENLHNLIDKLDACDEKLLDAQTNYYNAWAESKNYRIQLTDSELGLYKKEWRLQRNNACHEILTFYKDIVKISADVVDPTKSKLVPAHLQVNIENLYSAGKENIEKSPNYYSFLTKQEIQEQSQKNKEKKLKAKNL